MEVLVKKLKFVSLLIACTVTFSAVALARQTRSNSSRGEISPAEALSRYEKEIQATDDPYKKYFLLTKAAPTALAAGENEKASVLAKSLLELANTLSSNWNDGNGFHVANLVLGMVALAADDVSEAKRLLLEAGKTPGSPQLNSFGPNMLLAKQLLAKGERDVVIEYFELCDKFWELGHDELKEWKAIVIKGGIPSFRANLVYAFEPWKHEK